MSITREEARKLYEQEAIKNFCLKTGKELPPAVSALLFGEKTSDAVPSQMEFLNSLSAAVYGTVMNPKTTLYEANAMLHGVYDNQNAARKLANHVLKPSGIYYSAEEWNEKDFVSASLDNEAKKNYDDYKQIQNNNFVRNMGQKTL